MRRFYFGDDEENEDYEEENENLDEKMQPEFFSMTQFPMGDNLLDSAVRICENSIFWKFYSLKTKLNKIRESYFFLLDLEEGKN